MTHLAHNMLAPKLVPNPNSDYMLNNISYIMSNFQKLNQTWSMISQILFSWRDFL